MSDRKTAFLTYARRDSRYVFWVRKALQVVGFDVAIDFEIVKVGNVWTTLAKAIKSTDYQLIFCTESANASEAVIGECEHGKRHGIKQIAIIIDDLRHMDYFSIRYSHSNFISVSQLKEAGPATLAIKSELERVMGIKIPGSLSEFGYKHSNLHSKHAEAALTEWGVEGGGQSKAEDAA
ncbi:MAG: toll/interleukin-1 receptor domain-containing protein [Pseudomonadota bacterium]